MNVIHCYSVFLILVAKGFGLVSLLAIFLSSAKCGTALMQGTGGRVGDEKKEVVQLNGANPQPRKISRCCSLIITHL